LPGATDARADDLHIDIDAADRVFAGTIEIALAQIFRADKQGADSL
jgi:hypothetical protein